MHLLEASKARRVCILCLDVGLALSCVHDNAW